MPQGEINKGDEHHVESDPAGRAGRGTPPQQESKGKGTVARTRLTTGIGAGPLIHDLPAGTDRRYRLLPLFVAVGVTIVLGVLPHPRADAQTPLQTVACFGWQGSYDSNTPPTMTV